jgi:uncharacterized protein (DUF1499 family)
LAKSVSTAPDARDPKLRGRTFAIPFNQVWESARAVVSSSRRWHVVEEDDYEGVLRAEAITLILRRIDDVTIRVALDEDAQTRVDMTSTRRPGFVSLGRNKRRIRRFFRKLDRALEQARQGSSTARTP